MVLYHSPTAAADKDIIIHLIAHFLFLDTGLPCTVKEFTSAYVDLIKDLFPLAEFLPGTEKLLEHLWRSGVPAAVATSSTRKGFEVSEMLAPSLSLDLAKSLFFFLPTSQRRLDTAKSSPSSSPTWSPAPTRRSRKESRLQVR